MITESRVANAIGGKSARACDSCLRHRARWYCASDDAFLCQSCDSSVHAANHVASKHKRVRLNTSSSKPKRSVFLEHALPSWPQGVTRKARTPLNHARSSMNEQSKRKESDVGVLVPEFSCEEDATLVENEAQALFQVPVYDPLEDELCNIGIDDIFENKANETAEGLEHGFLYPGEELESFSGFLPPDVDLAELTADVESFLGNETLELDKRVKVEESELTNMSMDMVDDCWEFNEVKEEVKTVIEDGKMREYYEEENQKNAFLRLNYEAVITAWGSQGSPWTTGSRPEFNPDDCFTDLKGTFATETGGHTSGGNGSDGGREARVTRYREKRRTRLFSKKIRYEVRKLNAEKRPRIKGRFVKRTSLVPPSAAGYSFFN